MRLRSYCLLALSFALLSLSPAAAQPPDPPDGCYEVCAASCLKPWSIPDRWDDSGRPGWPAWKDNDHWDAEAFTDLDENGVWDDGEPFQDGVDMNRNPGPQDGQYTCERYDPLLTGYIAARDLGELMRFKVADPRDASQPGQFYPIDLCQGADAKGCPGADNYRWNIANCNPNLYSPGDWIKTELGDMIGPTAQGLRDLIAQDPTARWDDDCQCVLDSKFDDGASPRIALFAFHDPRIPLDSGKMSIRVVKLGAMFLEEVEGRDIMARFVHARARGGGRCAAGTAGGGYVYDCPNARAFLRGGNRTTRLASGRPATCVQVQPIEAAFALADMDPESITLQVPGAPERVRGVLDRIGKEKDTDHDGVDEATVCFAKDDLRRLFAAVAGRATVPVALDGALRAADGSAPETWSATLEMDVVGAPEAAGAAVATTPLGGPARIRFVAEQAGPARVRLYDVRGRLVRTLLDAPWLPAGAHEAAWDRRDAAGRPLGRGVYFYRVETRDGTQGGRIAIVG